MKKYILALILIVTGGSNGIIAQEICDNGIDDNGNGLIDLQDPLCICVGLNINEVDVTYKIPNADFEVMDCCPDFISQVTECLQGWVAPSHGTPDFLHLCDFMFNSVYDHGLYPFPSGGDGIVHIICDPNWKEYIATCLNEPLQPGTTYIFSLEIAFGPTSMSAQNGYPMCDPPGFLPPIPMTVYGNTTCNQFNMNGTACLPVLHPSWVELGTVVITPTIGWSTLSITFTPNIEVHALSFGAGCDVAGDYNFPGTCSPSFFLDDFQLIKLAGGGEIDVSFSGSPCEDGLLTANADPPGGAYQWYFNGVAINGQTGETFEITPVNYQPGTYTVTYTLGSECLWDSIDLSFVIPEPTIEIHSACYGETIMCAGESFQESGLYEVIFLSYLGCDSIVQCDIDFFPESHLTEINFSGCLPSSTTICGQTLTESGFYQIVCKDQYGCDSLIEANITILNPEAIILPHGSLACGQVEPLILDGSASSLNPVGQTSFYWSGPTGGIISNPSLPTIEIILPGEYCLVVTHEDMSVSCSDEKCVTVTEISAPPETPELYGPDTACHGDTFNLGIQLVGYANTELLTIDSTTFSKINDTLFSIHHAMPGNLSVCARAVNNCGNSDTVCIEILIHSVDTVFLSSTTCHPGDSGIFIIRHTNYLGCDSIVVNQVTLVTSDTITILQTSCDAIVPITDTLILTNYYGCDSIVYLTTIPGSVITQTNYFTICNDGLDFTDTTYVSGGNCDSLYISVYTHHKPDTTYIANQHCDPAETGVFVKIIPSHVGCDSIIIETVALLPSNTLFIDSIVCYKPPGGNDTVNLINQYGCDSIRIIQYLNYLPDTTYIESFTCSPANAGIHIKTLPGVHCDSIIYENIILLESFLTSEQIKLCAVTGPKSDTFNLISYEGCDSIHIIYYLYYQLDALAQFTPESCPGSNDGSIIVSHISNGSEPYAFRINQGIWTTENMFSGLSPGIYSVQIKDNEDCTITIDSLKIDWADPINVSASLDTIVELESYLTLNATASHPLASIQWSAKDELGCATCINTVLGPITTSQTVYLVATTDQGCNASTQFDIFLNSISNPHIFIPNVFSPGHDGINDIFKIYGDSNITGIRHFSIFDRWGNQLFHQGQTTIHDPNLGWNGYYKGKLMDPAVFVYFIEVEFKDGSVKIFKGDVTLVR